MDLAASILEAMSDSVSAVGRAAPVADRLARLVHLARITARAKYAALGVAGPDGDFTHFVTDGMSADLMARIGPLPRRHGLLALVLTEGVTIRSDDIGGDARFGWWPDAHPKMRAFVGVPVRSAGEVVAAYYVADREGDGGFADDAVRRIELLASHTGVAIELSRLWDERLELAVLDDRNRLAAELHDSVSQTLFSIALLSDAAAELGTTDAAQSAALLGQIRELARDAASELRAIIFELRPASLEDGGLVMALTKHIAILRRVHHGLLDLTVAGDRRVRPRVEREVFRIAQEAIGNAVRHGGGSDITVEVTFTDSLRLTVEDRGPGFDLVDPKHRVHHLGLTTMEERARAIGGSLEMRSTPGTGTSVRLDVPVGG